jgi:TolB-like protein/Tfp pilus assembly protein PilF
LSVAAQGLSLPPPTTSDLSGAKAGRISEVLKRSGLVLLLAITGIIGWYASQRRSWTGAVESATIHSLAVLPLENLSGDPGEDYFADGVTDELITDLGQISALRVISRTSIMQYKGLRKSLPQIARELNVDAVVEGSVVRSGGRVRITAQLVQAQTDRHLWAHSYEASMGDVLAVQERLASEIANQIRIEVTPQRATLLTSARTVNHEAYEAYLKGHYFWEKRQTGEEISKAISYFEEAIHHDAGFAMAYAGLAQVYAVEPDYSAVAPRESYKKAKLAAAKALELDSRLAEAHAALALVAVNNDFDWSHSEEEFRRAIELNPSYADAHHWHGQNLMFLGRSTEAIAVMERARELDPLSIIINANLGFVFYHARQFDRAIDSERTALNLDPNNPLIHRYLGLAYLQRGMYDEAIDNLRRAVDSSRGFPEYAAELARAYAAKGERAKARKILGDLRNRALREYVSSFSLAVAYTGLGEKDAALNHLERSYEERCDLLPTISVNPLFDSLRSDPRFQQLVRRIGFPT